MRLTPFRDRSSSESSGDESTIQASTSVDVFGYNENASIEARGSERETASQLEWDVVALLESRDEPVTIDELVDELYDVGDDVEAWGDVHEQLAQTDLPALDASDVVDFDPARGTVDLSASARRSPRHRRYALAGLIVLSLGLVFAPFVLNVSTVLTVVGLLGAGVGLVATAVGF